MMNTHGIRQLGRTRNKLDRALVRGKKEKVRIEGPGGWNPRYVAYATSRGMTPEECREQPEYPSSPGAGFILWMSDRHQAFAKAHPEAVWDGNIIDQDAWDRFLGIIPKEEA